MYRSADEAAGGQDVEHKILQEIIFILARTDALAACIKLTDGRDDLDGLAYVVVTGCGLIDTQPPCVP